MVPHVCFSFLCYPILEPYTSSSSDTWQIAHKSPSVKKIDQNRANCLLLPDWRFFWILLNIMFFNVTLITPHSTNRFPHQLAFLKGGKIWAHMGTSFVLWPSGSSGFCRGFHQGFGLGNQATIILGIVQGHLATTNIHHGPAALASNQKLRNNFFNNKTYQKYITPLPRTPPPPQKKKGG